VIADGLDPDVSRRLALVLLPVGFLFTWATWRTRAFDVAYGSEGMHIALEAIVGTVAVVTGGLAWTRYTRSGLLSDLTLALAFAVMAGENIFALVLPTLLDHELLRPSALWIAAALEVTTALLLLTATLAGGVPLRRRQGALVVLAVGAVVATVIGVLLAHGSRLSLPIDPALSPVGFQRQLFAGNTVALTLQGVEAVLLLVAGAVSLLRAREGADALFGWLGPALVVGALASANYALFPSLYSYWVYDGDLVRLAFCLMLAFGIATEHRASVRRTVNMAVLEERRRLARDLHDGVAQELAFIAAELDEITHLHPSLPWIRSAVDRGLYESRRAIAALTMPLDRPLAEVLAVSVEEIADRSGVEVNLNLDRSVVVRPPMQEALLRVAREALTNAVRHGRATSLQVSLSRNPDGMSLEIVDNGTGFDPSSIAGGFGLTSMRERVEVTGGRFDVESRTGAGARVVACWPGVVLGGAVISRSSRA
jgi:signal transduction histidine kinase